MKTPEMTSHPRRPNRCARTGVETTLCGAHGGACRCCAGKAARTDFIPSHRTSASPLCVPMCALTGRQTPRCVRNIFLSRMGCAASRPMRGQCAAHTPACHREHAAARVSRNFCFDFGTTVGGRQAAREQNLAQQNPARNTFPGERNAGL